MMTVVSVPVPPHRNVQVAVAAAVLITALGAAFGGALADAVFRWSNQAEYSHGFLIPAVTGWLLWTRRDVLAANIGRPAWIGLAPLLVAMLLHILGELSALFILSQAAVMLALLGVILCLGGISLLRPTFIPVAFLVFAIPLPYFVDSELSWRLQLLSSRLGVMLIHALQIPVFLDGNVIDLGRYKLEVVEACSGLRYLYPLLGFGFLIAWLFQAPLWQRALVFTSAVPVAIAMNAARLLLTAVLVNHFGTAQAEGALHLIEGWVIFLACAALLVAEAWILAHLTRRRLRFSLAAGSAHARPAGHDHVSKLHPTMLACLTLLGLTGLFAHLVSSRHETIPDRAAFVQFPAQFGGWAGRQSALEPEIEGYLGLTDYVLSDYSRSDGRAVNLYVAYYASQRDGASPHSPQVCVPGNGWEITQFERTTYHLPRSDTVIPLNRAVIEKDSTRQVMYYWFEERGRRVASEYLSKWYLLEDAIFRNRTDGALIRLTSPIYPGEEATDVDRRLQAFTRDLVPRLTSFLPRPPALPNPSDQVAQRPE
jgi:exosortase D (VPLPA-CTERM-specific)